MPIAGTRGVAVSGPRQLLVDQGETAWLLDLASDCPATLGASALRFQSARQDGQICAAGGDWVHAGGSTCMVDGVRPLSRERFAEALAAIRAQAEPACFDPAGVRRWHQIDRRTLEVEVRREGRFRIHLANTCRELADANDALFTAAHGRRMCGHAGETVFPLRARTALGPSPRLLRSRAEGQGCPVSRIEALPEPGQP